MFRVLTDEEARSVKRWRAPSLPAAGNAGSRAAVRPETVVGSLTRHRESLTGHSSGEGSVAASDRVDSAVQQADVLLPVNPSAEMLQTSYDEGYAQGFAEGSAAAHQQSGDEISTLLNNLVHQQLAQDSLLVDEVLILAKAMARLLVHREINSDATVLEDIVRSALERLDTKSASASIHVNPLDAAQLAMLLPENLRESLVADAALDRGDCVIESASSTIRSGVNELIDSLIVDLYCVDKNDAGSDAQDGAKGSDELVDAPVDEDAP